MPQQVNCQKCGALLYKGDELKSPEEIFNKHEGKCPKCGIKLSLTPENVDVKPAPGRLTRASLMKHTR